MIKLADTLQLATTKLKTRKVRLIVTVVITSLLFACLAFLASVTDGVIRSLNDFGKEGYGGRYFVMANPTTYNFMPDDQELIDHFKPIQRDLVVQKKAAAKKLNLTYDETTDTSLPLTNYKGDTTIYLNYGSDLIMKELAKRNDSIQGTDYASFQNLATSSGSIATYRSMIPGGMGSSYGFSGSSGALSVILNGKERITSQKDLYAGGMPSGVDTIMSMGWRVAESELIKPFILPGQTTATADDGTIPIIAPFSAAEEILGLKALPQTATASQKLERLVQVRKQIAGKTAELCYRNNTSSSLLSQALEQQKEIDANKTNKDYIKPSLIYQQPQTACGAVTAKTDTRSSDEKKQAVAQQAFDKQFGQYIEPDQGTIRIRIVGLSPDITTDANISAGAILSNLLSSSLGQGWVSPNDAVAANPLAIKALGGTVETLGHGSLAYYAEFKNLAATKAFIKHQTCSSGAFYDQASYIKGIEGCITQGKPFNVSAYGNNAGAIDEFKTGIWKVSRIAILAIMAIAALIMMGNVGKIIADGRRETAVFRALGAKRFDIAQIYLTYAILISLCIAVCAVVLGSIGAYVLSAHFSPNMSVAAVITYNAVDVDKQFLLFGFNAFYVLCITGLVILTGLISASIPLLTNMRRNPIRDMRDDS